MDRLPLRIGYCLSLSGALASNGKTARLAHQIWQENVNANRKLPGRPVELVCLDDQTNPRIVANFTSVSSMLRRSISWSVATATILSRQPCR